MKIIDDKFKIKELERKLLLKDVQAENLKMYYEKYYEQKEKWMKNDFNVKLLRHNKIINILEHLEKTIDTSIDIVGSDVSGLVDSYVKLLNFLRSEKL